MAELPRTSQSQLAGRLGATVVKAIVETSWGSSFQPVSQENDFGFDGYVHVFKDRKTATGIHIPVQIKTGKSYAIWRKGDRSAFHLKVEERHVHLWRQSNLPTLLIWVDDRAAEPKAYWGAFPKCMDAGSPRLLLRHRVGPHSISEILSFFEPAVNRQLPSLQGEFLIPGLGKNLRTAARLYYGEWRQSGSVNPLLGDIDITLRAWRNITKRSHGPKRVAASLSLLPVARAIISDSSSIQGSRYLPTRRGKAGFDVARVFRVFERKVEFRYRGPADVVVLVEEVTRFQPDAPVLATPAAVSTRRRFLGVYERVATAHSNKGGRTGTR